MNEQQTRSVLERAMALGVDRGITRLSSSGQSHIFVVLTHGRHDLASDNARARAQMLAAGLDAELGQAEAELTPVFEKKAATAAKAAATRAKKKAAVEQQAAAEQRPGDLALDAAYAAVIARQPVNTAAVHAQLVTSAQHRRLEGIVTLCSRLQAEDAQRARARAERAAELADERAATQIRRATERATRYLTAVDDAPDVGETWDRGGVTMVVTGYSTKPWVAREEGAIEDNDDFDLVGELVTYVYYRPAREDELAHGAQLAADRQARLAAERAEEEAREAARRALWAPYYACNRHGIVIDVDTLHRLTRGERVGDSYEFTHAQTPKGRPAILERNSYDGDTMWILYGAADVYAELGLKR